MNRRRNLFWTPRRIAAAFFLILILALAVSSISLPARAGGSATTEQMITRPVPQHLIAVNRGTVYPAELPPATPGLEPHARPLRMADPDAYRMRKAAAGSEAALPELPSLATLALTATTFSTNFAGLGFPDSQCGPQCEPPDTQVAAGPNNIFEVINTVGKVYDKSGNTALATFNLNTFFNVSAADFSSDPRIEYDTLSGRWFISFLTFDNTDLSNSTTGFWNLAVSQDSNPLGPFDKFQVVTPGSFPDQPSLGFNDDKVVTGGNSFSCVFSQTNPSNPNCANGDFEGNEFLVWNKGELLANAMTIDTDLNGPEQDSSNFPIIPVKSRTSTSTLWMVSAFNNVLNVWSITGVPPGSTATDTPLVITAFTDPPAALQRNGGSVTIDTGDSRLTDAVYRDGIMWASGTDACKPTADTVTRACLLFFEVLTTGATPVLQQDFSFGTRGAYDYYPSVDLDSSDDLITSFTQSSSAEFASAFVDGRLAGDPINTLGTPVLFHSGSAAYNGERWGDYSGAGVDPADQTAVWVASEYATTPSTGLNWGTWIAEARLLPGSPTQTATRTATATRTPTATATSTISATPTPSSSPSASTSATSTATSTATPTASPTATTSSTPSASATSTSSGSPTATPSGTPTVNATPTATDTATSTASATVTATITATDTPMSTPTLTAIATATATATATPTATETQTATPTATPTAIGILNVSTSEVNFGMVKLNKSKTKHFTIQNRGKFPLDVMFGNNLTPPFTISPSVSSFTLSKGKKKTVTVKFTPTDTTAAVQILSIHSDDPIHGSHPVTVTGTGK